MAATSSAARKSTPTKTGKVQPPARVLRDLAGVGPSIEENLHRLGIHEVAALARSSGDELYRKLCILTGARQDPCVLDTFRCAVAQAKDPQLPSDQSNWWWWSGLRKRGELPPC